MTQPQIVPRRICKAGYPLRIAGTITGDDGQPQALGGATVNFTLRDERGTVVIDHADVAVVDPAGVISYESTGAATAPLAGDYVGSLEVVPGDGSAPIPFPDWCDIQVHVLKSTRSTP